MTNAARFGIKEATGDIERLQAIQALVDDDFMLYSGDDFRAKALIEQGGHGVVTVSGNVVPRQMASLCRLAGGGESEAAEALGQKGITPTIADARFAKPLDRELILRLARGRG